MRFTGPSVLSPSSQPSQSRKPSWISVGVVLCVLMGIAILFSHRSVDPDLWGHITYGDQWLESGKLPRTATHTYTAEGYPWINHENLSEWALAVGYRLVGIHILMVFKCLLGLAMITGMILTAVRRGAKIHVAALSMLPVAACLAEFWAARPQLSSFLCFAGMIWVLEQAFVHWPDQRRCRFLGLSALVPLFGIWANAHGGFVAGLCVLAVYIGSRCVDAVGANVDKRWSIVGRLSLILGSCFAVTLLNPYGAKLHDWLFDSLHRPRPEISEWVHLLDGGPIWIPFAILSLMAGLVVIQRRLNGVHVLVLAIVWVQALIHMRHVPFFAILCGFWLPVHVGPTIAKISTRWTRPKITPQPASPPSAGWVRKMLVAEFVFIVGVIGVILYRNFRDVLVKADEYPIAAIQFIHDHDLNGRLVVTYDWAQYALMALAPETRVGFDGRFRTCYPQHVVDMHFDLVSGNEPGRRSRAVESGPYDPTRVLRYGDPDLVLIDRKRDPNAVRVMKSQTDWVRLYQDQISQLWGRKQVYDQPGRASYFPIPKRSVTDSPQRGSKTWPALPVDRS